MLTALDGVVIVRGPRGERTITPSELFRGYLTTSLGPDEILVEVCLPAMPAGAGFAFEEFSRRHGDFALAGIATMLVGQGQRCTAVRLATAGAGPTPIRLRDAEKALAAADAALFEPVDPAWIVAALEAVAGSEFEITSQDQRLGEIRLRRGPYQHGLFVCYGNVLGVFLTSEGETRTQVEIVERYFSRAQLVGCRAQHRRMSSALTPSADRVPA